MPTPPMPSRRRTLKTQLDCRRALAWVFGELEAGRLEVARARVMIYALQNLSSILERTEVELEVQAIRATLQEAGLEVKR